MKTSLLWGLLVLTLGGCASQGMSMRSLPPDTPAADNATALANAEAFAAAAKAAAATESPQRAPPEQDASVPPPPPVTAADAPSMRTYDPWSKANRFVYRFNARFDEAIFFPVASVYRKAPSPMRKGVRNFFSNLTEIYSTLNSTLQWRLKYGVRAVSRFAINTTIGIGGLFDVAKAWNLPQERTGFSDTLGKWGVHPGPYLVIPLLGPSTLRDGGGYLADYGVLYGVNPLHMYRGDLSWGLSILDAINVRSNVDFRYYSSGSPFEYENIRFLFVRKRLIEDAGLRAHEAVEKPAPNTLAGE
jgi:phospholipid-binding lipoprotein MlaA